MLTQPFQLILLKLQQPTEVHAIWQQFWRSLQSPFEVANAFVPLRSGNEAGAAIYIGVLLSVAAQLAASSMLDSARC